MTNVRLIALVLIFLAISPGAARDPLDRDTIVTGMRIHYAPDDNLEEIDRRLIAGAQARIDMAAYVLTDRVILNTLIEAARRGVKIRLYLDPDQPGRRTPDDGGLYATLLRATNVEARFKSDPGSMMHLKAYQVDAKLVRTGSTNFSFSGTRQQDNDLLIVYGQQAAARFIANFERMWMRADNAPFRK